MPTAVNESDRKRVAARVPGYILLTDQDADLPLHERVYRRLRHLIQSGTLAHGSRIAPSRALAASLGISRNSVLTALERLIADGLLETRRNSGVYVTYARPAAAACDVPGATPEDVPFALGWAMDIFPVEIWKRLQMRHWRSMPDFALHQGNRLGLPDLRKAIATYVTLKRGLVCSPAQVIVTTSIPSGIDLAVRALGLPGSDAWLEEPCCQAPLAALRHCGVNTIAVPIDTQGIDVAAGVALAPRARMALVSPTCQAPWGMTMSDKRRRALLDWARANAAWIFEDDFNWNGDGINRAVPPLAALEPARVIYLNSFNNIMFSGLRIAYLVVPENLVDRFAAVRGTEGEVNTPNQLVLTDFIESGYLDDHTRRLDANNAERRAALVDSVRRTLGDFLTPLDTPGGYFSCATRKIPEAAFIAAAKAGGVVVSGLSEYCAQPPRRDEVILGFSQYTPAVISAAALKLRAALLGRI